METFYSIYLDREDGVGIVLLEEGIKSDVLYDHFEYWDSQYPDGYVFYQVQ